MFTKKRYAIALLFLGLATIPLWSGQFLASALGQDTPPATQAKKEAADEKTIIALIAQLGDEAFQKRQEAEKRLVAVEQAGGTNLLRKAAKESLDAEVRERAGIVGADDRSQRGCWRFFPPSLVFDVAFSKDGQSIAVACDDKVVRIYDWKTNDLRQTLKGHTARVWTLAYSPDGKKMASASGDYGNPKVVGEIILWDLAKGTADSTFKGHEGGIFGVALSPDGKTLVSCGGDETIRMWNLADGKEKNVGKEHKGPVRRIFFTPDGKFVASSGLDGTVRFWNPETLREERQILAHSEGVSALTFSPDGKVFLPAVRPSSPTRSGVIKLWDMTTFAEKTIIKGPSARVVGLAVSPDSRLLAMGGGLTKEFGEVKIFDLATGSERATFRDHKEWVECVTFSPDGSWLVSAGGYTRGQKGEIRIWDLKRMAGKGE